MTSFTEATAVEQLDDHTYRAQFVQDWCIGTVPHGGYVTSTFQKVVRKHFDTTLRKQNQPHTIALHIEFLRRTGVGEATFKVKTVKLGRQTSIVHVTLTQDGREEVVAYVTNSNMDNEEGISAETKWVLSPSVKPVDIAALEAGRDPNWGERKAWPHEEFRHASARVRGAFPRGGQPGPAIYDDWMSFRHPEDRFTNEALGFVVDMFPQLIEAYLLNGVDTYSYEFEQKTPEEQEKLLPKPRPKMWYPTLLLNMEVKKALPKEGVKWLFSRLQAKVVKNGRYDIEVICMDTEGDVVAVSHHIAFAVDASRNTAKRRKADAKL